MCYEIHVLPIGFDINRLTTPLMATKSGFDPDEVVLLRSSSDIIEEDTAERSRAEKLVENAYEETKRTLEDQLLPTETRVIPDLNDYLAVYEAAYELLDELSEPEPETEREVHVNVSAVPKAAALAFSNAATALVSETPSKGSRLHIYYVAPEEYLEVGLVDFLEAMQPRLQGAVDFGQKYWDIEERLFDTISGSLNYLIDDLEADIEDTYQHLEAAEPAQRDDEWKEQLAVARERAKDLREYVSYKWIIREEGLGRGPAPDLLFAKFDYREVEDEIAGVRSHLEDINTAVRTANQGGVPDGVIDRIDEILNLLEETLPSWAGLEWWSTYYPGTVERIEWVLTDSNEHLDEIERYGMTKGLGNPAEQIQTPIAPPPVASLRDMELLILYALADEQTVDSMGTLAQHIATALRQHLESFRLDGQATSDTVPEFVDQMAAKANESDIDGVLETLEGTMSDRIRSRLQYNVDSLEEKQYVRRVTGDDSRRARITLTSTGEQWVRTHDVAAVSRESVEAVLTKEVERFVASDS